MYFNMATCQMGQMTLYAIKCLNIFQPITRIIIINPIMELLSITYTLPDYIKIHFINQKKTPLTRSSGLCRWSGEFDDTKHINRCISLQFIEL